jgi:hypothetical protein
MTNRCQTCGYDLHGHTTALCKDWKPVPADPQTRAKALAEQIARAIWWTLPPGAVDTSEDLVADILPTLLSYAEEIRQEECEQWEQERLEMLSELAEAQGAAGKGGYCLQCGSCGVDGCCPVSKCAYYKDYIEAEKTRADTADEEVARLQKELARANQLHDATCYTRFTRKADS